MSKLTFPATQAKSKGGPLTSLETTYSNAKFVLGVSRRWTGKPSEQKDSLVVISELGTIALYLEEPLTKETLETLVEALRPHLATAKEGTATIDDDGAAVYLMKA